MKQIGLGAAAMLLGCLTQIHSVKAEENSVSLFGIELEEATRPAMREAVKEAGAKPLRESDFYWYDRYQASMLIDDADELLIGYTSDSRLAQVVYGFRAPMNPKKAIEIKDMVASKYGPPEKQEGREQLGELTYTWNKGGVKILVERDWPDTSVLLKYRVPEGYNEMQARMREQEEQATAEKWREQGDAY